jgi:hypothetical protein
VVASLYRFDRPLQRLTLDTHFARFADRGVTTDLDTTRSVGHVSRIAGILTERL